MRRSNWLRFVLVLSLAVVAAATACNDDESTSDSAHSGGSAGSAGAGRNQKDAGGRAGSAGATSGGSTADAGSQGAGACAGTGATLFPVNVVKAPPGMSLVVAQEVSRSPSFVLLGTVAEASADRMSSPNYVITRGPSK